MRRKQGKAFAFAEGGTTSAMMSDPRKSIPGKVVNPAQGRITEPRRSFTPPQRATIDGRGDGPPDVVVDDGRFVEPRRSPPVQFDPNRLKQQFADQAVQAAQSRMAPPQEKSGPVYGSVEEQNAAAARDRAARGVTGFEGPGWNGGVVGPNQGPLTTMNQADLARQQANAERLQAQGGLFGGVAPTIKSAMSPFGQATQPGMGGGYPQPPPLQRPLAQQSQMGPLGTGGYPAAPQRPLQAPTGQPMGQPMGQAAWGQAPMGQAPMTPATPAAQSPMTPPRPTQTMPGQAPTPQIGGVRPGMMAKGGRIRYAEGGVTEGPNANIDDDTRARALAALAAGMPYEEPEPAPKPKRRPKPPAPPSYSNEGRSSPAPAPTRATGMGPMPMSAREAQAATAPKASYSNEGRAPTRPTARQTEATGRAASARRIAADEAKAKDEETYSNEGRGSRKRETGLGLMAKGGSVKPAEVKAELSFMKRNKAPASMIKAEKKEHGFAKGGSIDGCAQRGKTRAKTR